VAARVFTASHEPKNHRFISGKLSHCFGPPKAIIGGAGSAPDSLPARPGRQGIDPCA
jgi:hypothetical protein